MEFFPFWARHRASVIAVAAAVISGVILILWAWQRPATTTPLSELPAAPDMLMQPVSANAVPMPTVDATIVVYVSGAVRSPDVYVLPASARVKDVVLAAGGLTDEADAEQINLAERLLDGQHVQVMRRGEAAVLAPPSEASQPDADRVDMNNASGADLDDLPGIGEAIAQRIVDYRSEHGPFTKVEDLLQVKGIGASVFEQIAPLITVGSATP